MNRQIKFRVWNGYEMLEDVTVGKHGAFWTSGISESDNHSLGNTTKYDNYLSVMQFTGLHDKNGKEVFEGDIFELGVVEWIDGAFRFKNSNCYMVIDSHIAHNFEIIGNIFENPDLVKL